MNRRPLRLIHVITDLKVGGAEIMLWKLLSGLNSDIFELHVVSLVDGGELIARIEKLGIPVVSLGLEPGKFGLKAWMKLKRLGSELQPDVVQGWMYHGNLAATILASGAGDNCRLYWNVRQSLPEPGQEKLLTRMVIRLGGLLSGQPNAIIFNAHVSINQHTGQGYRPEKAVYIGNGFDLEMFHPRENAGWRLRERLGIKQDTKLVGQLGRFHHVKGFDIFLAAASEVISRRTDIHFVCAGRGVDGCHPSLSRIMDQKGMASRVHFLGEVNDTPDILAGLDLLCSSSRAEAFANVIGEAMACGVPCVVSDVGDSAMILGGSGIVYPAENVAALVTGILDVFDLSEVEMHKMGMNGRARIASEFSMPGIVQQYEQLYLAI